MVGWVRRSARHPLSAQIEQLRAAGVQKIYGEAKDETVMDAVKHTSGRAGSIIVVTTLARLGTSKAAIAAVVDEAHERGAVVLELGSGRRSNDARVAFQMAMEAADELANDHRAFTPREAKAAAARSWEGRRKPRTSRAKALRVWRDKANYRTVRDALAHPDMDGWSVNDCYRKDGGLGPRYKPEEGRGGRKPKSKNT